MPRVTQASIDAPDRLWLTAAQAATWLAMNVRVFRRLVEEGVFPAGTQRRGEKVLRWSRTDVAVMQYLLANDRRFGWAGTTQRVMSEEEEVAERLKIEREAKEKGSH